MGKRPTIKWFEKEHVPKKNDLYMPNVTHSVFRKNRLSVHLDAMAMPKEPCPRYLVIS